MEVSRMESALQIEVARIESARQIGSSLHDRDDDINESKKAEGPPS